MARRLQCRTHIAPGSEGGPFSGLAAPLAPSFCCAAALRLSHKCAQASAKRASAASAPRARRSKRSAGAAHPRKASSRSQVEVVSSAPAAQSESRPTREPSLAPLKRARRRRTRVGVGSVGHALNQVRGDTRRARRDVNSGAAAHRGPRPRCPARPYPCNSWRTRGRPRSRAVNFKRIYPRCRGDAARLVPQKALISRGTGLVSARAQSHSQRPTALTSAHLNTTLAAQHCAPRFRAGPLQRLGDEDALLPAESFLSAHLAVLAARRLFSFPYLAVNHTWNIGIVTVSVSAADLMCCRARLRRVVAADKASSGLVWESRRQM